MITARQTQEAKHFIERIGQAAFPCVGAKSAAASNNIEFHEAGDLRSGEGDEPLLRRLQAFATNASDEALFVSFIALFPDTPSLDEASFERALWQRLQALHELDVADFAWDPSVSDQPGSAQFSMSLGGRAWYVIGLHPGSSREARRFRRAALVFNLHSQFETLREDGRYDKLRESIIERDIAYSGTRNPMLAVHGETSEARQYSGRQVGAEWQCPFSARRPE
ncbi:MAG: guanitoxin biosynthesis heme-dependent pre-guanitoxin N-hydroxylase GntA [Arenimonas sp.]